jgi:hypothetical protein
MIIASSGAIEGGRHGEEVEEGQEGQEEVADRAAVR